MIGRPFMGSGTAPVAYAQIRVDKPAADADAADDFGPPAIGVIFGSPTTVLTAAFLPDGALTAHVTNYAQLQVYRVRAGVPTLIAYIDTQPTLSGGSGNWTSGVAVTLESFDPVCLVGDVLVVGIEKFGAGVIVPAGSFVVAYG